MSLVPSLLQAIVSVDGEALVMHASEKPYVVSPSGQVELASGGLTLDAVSGIVAQLLPPEFQQTLEEFGAVQYSLPPLAEFPREQFTVIAARGGDDVWAEIRRRRVPDDDRGAEAFFAPPHIAPPDPAIEPPITDGLASADEDAYEVPATPADYEIRADALSSTPVASSAYAAPDATHVEPVAPTAIHLAPAPAVVLAMSRNPTRAEIAPPALSDDARLGLERLLRAAAARGASTLYLSSDARPSMRVDGKLQVLDKEPVLTSHSVVSLLVTLMPGRSHEALRTGATTEWSCDIEDIGRVRCVTFNDHRGPGGVFRLMPRAMSVDQLGLTREVQALTMAPEGLVLVAGPRSSGKRTLIFALVDLINRTRFDHVVTIQREVAIVHTNGNSLISQREVRGGDEELLAATRAALREDPDVIVLEEIRTGALMDVALEAAASGRLVLGGLSGHNATEAVDRVIDLYTPEYAQHVRVALADHLRGVVAQILLPRIGGGRVAAREVMLNTPAVAGIIAEGKTSQLPMAIEGGRRDGMVPLNDGLLAHVQNRVVDLHEVSRYVGDLPAFLAVLERHGIDTSAIERRA